MSEHKVRFEIREGRLEWKIESSGGGVDPDHPEDEGSEGSELERVADYAASRLPRVEARDGRRNLGEPVEVVAGVLKILLSITR
jgi:hypothetical protein